MFVTPFIPCCTITKKYFHDWSLNEFVRRRRRRRRRRASSFFSILVYMSSLPDTADVYLQLLYKSKIKGFCFLTFSSSIQSFFPPICQVQEERPRHFRQNISVPNFPQKVLGKIFCASQILPDVTGEEDSEQECLALPPSVQAAFVVSAAFSRLPPSTQQMETTNKRD
jgi:hypothetical protein